MNAKDASAPSVPAPRTITALTSPSLRSYILGALVGAVASAAVLASAAAASDTRTLDLYNVHTKERLTITFKKNGRYIPSALSELNRFLRDWRRNESIKIDPRLFDTVWELYRKAGSHMPIHVVCGYRSLATNNMLRSRSSAVAKRSQHTLGRAMDLNMPDVSIDRLRTIAMKMQYGGVGWYPSANSPFVHIDVGSVRSWPRMPRTQLVQLFPDGKTAHIPSDGKPLSGYRTALAEIQRRKGMPIAMGTEVASADASARHGNGGGLIAMLFGGGEEDTGAELEAAADDGDVPAPARPTTPARPAAPVMVAKVAPVPAKTPTAQPAVLTAAAPLPLLASAPRPQPAPRPAAITSLAQATLPAEAVPPAAIKLAATDIAAPLPLARPRNLVPEPVQLAALDVPAVLPPTKPAAPSHAADALAAQSALAEVAGAARREPELMALAYASARAEPTPPRPAALPAVTETASLPPARPTRPAVAGIAGEPSSLTRLADPKGDMLGGIEAALVASEDGPSLLDGSQSVYWGHFTALTHPDQRHLAPLLRAPAMASSATFAPLPYPGMVSTRFTGPVNPPDSVVVFVPANQLAMR